jgi:bifunctional DNA-binding transcriptional regulator/antitoxin component of YhaV-PrlF toxin-antitoxin module
MAKILGASKVTVRYQITVPGGVRKILKIKIGDTLVFAEEHGKRYGYQSESLQHADIDVASTANALLFIGNYATERG